MVIRTVKVEKYALDASKIGSNQVLFLRYTNGIIFLNTHEISVFMFEPNFEFMYLYTAHKTYKIATDVGLVLATMQHLKLNQFIPVKNGIMVNVALCLHIEYKNGSFALFLKNFGLLPAIDLSYIKKYVYTNFRYWVKK